MKIGLVVPVYKNFVGFAELIRSVDTRVQPIVIDNWTNNRGVSKAWNIGLAEADMQGCDVAIVANDDVVFQKSTIHSLFGAVWNRGFDLATATNARDLTIVGLGQGDPVDQEPDFSCFAVKPGDFLNRFGHFDENFTPAYFEDNDMAYRLKLEGANMGRLRYAGMYHKGSVTQNWEGRQVVTGPMFRSNQDYYVRKWGGTPGNERYVRPYDLDSLMVRDWIEE